MGTVTTGTVDMKLEVVVLPVADVDRSKSFYTGLGWRLDSDHGNGKGYRLVQVTPPGSPCSVVFGRGLTAAAAPNPAEELYLVVSDIEAARAELVDHGVDVSGLFHYEGAKGRVAGPDPQRRSYATFASFHDPDGNRWMLQELTQRLPGRVQGETTFSSASDLAGALRRAEAAHGKHEARTGRKDPDWPDWYAEYMLREQTGQELPT